MQQKILSAADILQAKDVTIEPVDVPEWGGIVHVRSLSALEREQYFDAIRRTEGYGKKERTIIIVQRSTARLAWMTLCDEQGNRLFQSEGDIAVLARKSSRAMERVVKAAQRLNGLDDEEENSPKNGSPASVESADASNTSSPDTSDGLAMS